MNDLNQLGETAGSAWSLVKQWLASSRKQVEILPLHRGNGENVLRGLQVTTRSPLGAIAFETGGILFDHGWLRFLGSGCDRMRLDLLSFTPAGGQGAKPLLRALVVAHDAVGGFFALNGGMFLGEQGTAYYLAPDTLEWESLEMGYSQLLHWAAYGDLAGFYEDLRWPGWEREAQLLGCDQALSIYPPPWARGDPMSARSRHAVPVVELWNLEQDVGDQIRGLPDGTVVDLSVSR